jgi:beta-lactamase regulating signal transducer with metallopeptidase domain
MIKTSLVVLVALGVTTLLRHRSAALRHWVLAVAIGCSAAMPLMEIALPSWPVRLTGPAIFQIEMANGTVRLTSDPSETLAPPSSAGSGSSRTERNVAGAQTQSGIPFALEDVRQLILPVWIAGFAISALILLIGLARLAWLASRSQLIGHGKCREMLDQIAGACGVQRPVLLLQSDHPSLLVTWGLLVPKVILPASAGEWSEGRARVVLSHELAHIRRGDWIVQMAGELLRAVYWFNPLMWIVCRRLRLESEHACDDEVISMGVEGPDYATHLVDLARGLRHSRQTWFPAPAMARPSSLERRVRAMLNERLDRNRISLSAQASVVVVLLSLTAAIAAAQNAFATFSGSVVDEQGQGIPDVSLVLTDAQRQAKYEVKSNSVGAFEFVGLPPAEYGFEVRGIGFRELRERLSVAGENLQRSITLQIGRLQETVNIVGGGDGDDSGPPQIREAKAPDLSGCKASSVGGRIIPPRKIRNINPQYPPSLRGTGTSGAVVMEGRIEVDGFIRDIRIIGDAHPELANAAIAAVREWQFSHTLLNCRPVEVGMTITANFRHMPPVPPPAPPKP